MGAIPVNQPYSYEDEVPAYADPHISQRMNGVSADSKFYIEDFYDIALTTVVINFN